MARAIIEPIMREAWYTSRMVKHETPFAEGVQVSYVPRVFEVVGEPGSGVAVVGLRGYGDACVDQNALVKVHASDVEHTALLKLPHTKIIVPSKIMAEGILRLGSAFDAKKITILSGNPPAPKRTWTDDFNRSNESVEDDASWTLLRDTYADRLLIVSNEVTTAYNDCGCYASGGHHGANMYAEVDVTVLSQTSGPGARATAYDSMYGVRVDTGYGTHRVQIMKNMSTIVAWMSQNQSATFRFRIEVNGTGLEAFIDDVSKVSTSDSGVTGSGYGCLFHTAQSSGTHMDNFECGAIGVTLDRRPMATQVI